MRLRCPSCELVVEVREGKARVKCPNCGFKADVPNPAAAPAAAPLRADVPARRPAPRAVPVQEPPAAQRPTLAQPARVRKPWKAFVSGRRGAILASVSGGVLVLLLGLGFAGTVLMKRDQDAATGTQAVEDYLAASESTFDDNRAWSDNVDVILTIYRAERDALSLEEDPTGALAATSAAGSVISYRLARLAVPEPARTYAAALQDFVNATVRAADDWAAAFEEADPDGQAYFVAAARSEIEGLCGIAEDLTRGIGEAEAWYARHRVPLEESRLAKEAQDVDELRFTVCGS